jgi:uncharacterized protein (UPF0332 family)
MSPKLSDHHLLNFTKGNNQTIKGMEYGIYLATQSGLTLDQLIESASRDRFHLARGFLRSARQAFSQPNPNCRVALARSYYAMYHAARSVAFFVHRGDDHESHQELPRNLPKDFVERTRWENEIKTARLERNRADYDPYPKGDRAFLTSSAAVLKSAEEFLPAARQYLKRKGCKI